MSKTMQAVVLAVMVAVPPGAVAIADTGLPDIPPHRHWVMHPDGTMSQVGPRVCDNPDLQEAHNQFHSNNHVAVPGSQGSANAGLHNGRGGEILFTGC